MIRFINIYKGSLSVAYTTESKALENAADGAKTRVIFVTGSGYIKDITDSYEGFKKTE